MALSTFQSELNENIMKLKFTKQQEQQYSWLRRKRANNDPSYLDGRERSK